MLENVLCMSNVMTIGRTWKVSNLKDSGITRGKTCGSRRPTMVITSLLLKPHFTWLKTTPTSSCNINECVHATTFCCCISDSPWFDYLHNKHVLEQKKKNVWLVHVGKRSICELLKKLCRHASCVWQSHIESAPLLTTAS